MHRGGRFISDAVVGAAFIPNGKAAGNPQARQVQALLEGVAAK